MSDHESLNFFLAIKLMFFIVTVIGVLVALMFFLNTRRNSQIVAQYTDETQAYIIRNGNGLNLLLTDTFDDALECQTLIEVQKTDCQIAIRTNMYKFIPTDLKDFSSTFFIRLHQRSVQNLQLNGQASESSFVNNVVGEQQQKIFDLLTREVNQIPWDDYFWSMTGKEVVVPVDYQGHRIGAIVRRVIE